MIQALIATIIQVAALIFAIGGGGIVSDVSIENRHEKGGFCILLALLLSACALGVAAR